MIRKVDKIVRGTKTTDGAGVSLTRVISRPDVYDFDPFLMLDAFDSRNPEDYIKGFPWHPHRGIETVTYLIQGDIEHGDSLGNSGSILDGCCQWMTAGGGILHQEMPKPSERMLGVQLWINLPAKDKMAPPKYRDITSDKVYEVAGDKHLTKIISGKFRDTKSEVTPDYVKANFFDVHMEPGSIWEYEFPENDTVFIYCIEGEVTCLGDDSVIGPKEAALFTCGTKLNIECYENKSRFLLFSGTPLNEPIAWGGPIVMNTKEELNKAFEDLKTGNFVSH